MEGIGNELRNHIEKNKLTQGVSDIGTFHAITATQDPAKLLWFLSLGRNRFSICSSLRKMLFSVCVYIYIFYVKFFMFFEYPKINIFCFIIRKLY